jgi:hypothetical protein
MADAMAFWMAVKMVYEKDGELVGPRAGELAESTVGS